MSLPDCIICYLGMQQCPQWHYLIAISCSKSAIIAHWLVNQVRKDLQELKTYCVELAQLIIFGITHKCQQFVRDFCQCLVDEIKRVHENNRPSPAVNPVPNSYNPSSGTAYYFTPSGAQLCQLPTYEVCTDYKEKNSNFDDISEVDQTCRKMFPRVSKVILDILFCGSTQYMDIVMVSI